LSAADATPLPEIGVVLINNRELERKLALRGKTTSDLVRARATTFDTLAKIRSGKKVSIRVLRKITAQLAMWPVLEHTADLLAAEA